MIDSPVYSFYTSSCYSIPLYAIIQNKIMVNNFNRSLLYNSTKLFDKNRETKQIKAFMVVIRDLSQQDGLM